MPPAPRSATTWKRAGVALMVVGSVSGVVLSGSPGWPILGQSKLLFAILTAPTILLFAGAFLSWRGRQYAAQASVENVITDTKPHLLYLRPFRSDYSTRREVFRAHSATTFAATEEEQLADVLQPFGELVAIGRPGESLPTPGAARIYTSDEEWKDVVKRQMQTARLVVIMAAVEENVLWELTQAVSTLEPQKLLILVLEMNAKDYESFRSKVNPILGVSLPDLPTLTGFISFAADWKPSFLAFKAPYFRSFSFKSRAKYALRPVFENFGLEWQPPPISVVSHKFFFTIVGLVVALILAFCVLH